MNPVELFQFFCEMFSIRGQIAAPYIKIGLINNKYSVLIVSDDVNNLLFLLLNPVVSSYIVVLFT